MSQLKHFCECDHIYQNLFTIGCKLLKQIKRVIIFKDANGEEIFLITISDEVFGFGRNYYGRLGLGHKNQVNEPTIINELCGKSVKDIKCGYFMSVALTEFGNIYTFGYGQSGVTGNGDTSSYDRPNSIPINNQLIDAIDVSNFSTILLTQTGQLYWFGYFGWNGNPVYYPTNVGITSENEIMNISCGSDYMLALTVTGKVFSWGHNSYGQLGLGHNSNTNSTEMINLNESIFIKQISCGYNHSLLLTSNGRIYSFGWNSSGQLGIGNTTDSQNTPQLIITELKFKEICCFENISMAFTENDKLYVWGDIKEKVFSPKLTKFSSFQEVVNSYGIHRRTLKPLSTIDLYKPKPMGKLTETMAKAFNNPKNSDLKFKVKSKGSDAEFKYIYGHKWFIGETSEYFKTMFANKWSENKSNEIQIKEYSYESYYQYIRSLYTDYIETENIEVLLELLSITEQYLDSDKKDKCVEQIKGATTLQNVCSIFSDSIKFRSENLREFCFKLMSENPKELVKTDDYKQMEPIYAKEFFTEYFLKK